MSQYKNILFDLGGVLIDIDYHKTTQAFVDLGVKQFSDLYTQYTATDTFEKFETGNIIADDFYQMIQQYTHPPLTHAQIDHAWNAMLLDIRQESLDCLRNLKDRYNIYLLSNTNTIHLKAFNDILQQQTGLTNMDGFFIKSYYSHRIQMRKPYAATYTHVLKDAGILAQETLFIDDSKHNIEGAVEAGLHTRLLLPNERIEQLNL